MTSTATSINPASIGGHGHKVWIPKPGGGFLHVTRSCRQSSVPVPDSLQAPPVILLHDQLGSLENKTSAGDAVLRIEGHEPPPDAIAACQLWMAVGGETRDLTWQGRRIGTIHEDEEARYLFIGDLAPSDPAAPRREQAREVIESLVSVLEANGMALGSLMRTWFYLDRILDWYQPFNEVRNACFERLGIFNGLIPASTGIGCSNYHGSALVMKALAIEPRHTAPATAVTSPLQCPAPDYRSAFSRAVEVNLPSHRQLHISGTASIGSCGETLHVGKLDAQVNTTLEVVSAILSSRGFEWCHATRAIAYVRHSADLPAVCSLLADHPVGNSPLHIMQADICRDELLFELELDACKMDPSLCRPV